jgi:hypothetical protein
MAASADMRLRGKSDFVKSVRFGGSGTCAAEPQPESGTGNPQLRLRNAFSAFLAFFAARFSSKDFAAFFFELFF